MGRPFEEVTAAWPRQATLGVDDAVALGYVDAVETTRTARPGRQDP